MASCQICSRPLRNFITSYRLECRDCRRARRRLRREGVSHRAVKEYLKAVGLELEKADTSASPHYSDRVVAFPRQ